MSSRAELWTVATWRGCKRRQLRIQRPVRATVCVCLLVKQWPWLPERTAQQSTIHRARR